MPRFDSPLNCFSFPSTFHERSLSPFSHFLVGAFTHTSRLPSVLWPHPSCTSPPSLIITADQLKPGRVFIVANLAGAYYTQMELLSRLKFDFRVDNLLHVGNLVAPPPDSGNIGGDSLLSDPSRRARNSSSVLKLLRRHSSVGPMGAHECLVLLAAARSNRLRAQQQAEEERQLLAAASCVKAPPHGCRSMLSLQLAAAGVAPLPPPSLASRAAVWGVGSMASSSSMYRSPWLPTEVSDSSISDDDDGDEMTQEDVVASPMTPYRGERLSYGTTVISPVSGLSWDDADLAHLLSMPAEVVLEPYGVRLVHAGPASASLGYGFDASGHRYHTLYSHRRRGDIDDGAGGGSSSTGLAACRSDVVRFAVLPPLQTLQRASHGFGAKMAAAMAPTRADLLLEVIEESLSELDA